MKKVYCIVVTYNAMKWIDRCLQSLINSSYKSVIIVVDNGSTDSTVTHIKSNYPSVELILAEKNLGFGRGNNIGIRKAIQVRADYVFLVNQDVWIEKDTISQLVTAHIDHPEYGILSPVHLNGAGTDFDDYFFGYLLQSDSRRFLLANSQQSQLNREIIDTKFVNAAAWFISSYCLEQVGGFDPIFFHYGEDDHYAHRSLVKGIKLGILPSARIYHDRNLATPGHEVSITRSVSREWSQLLVYACDLNRNNYRIFMVKRCFRHLMQLGFSCVTFNWSKAYFNYAMAGKIIRSMRHVSKSRQIAKDSGSYAHL